MAMSHNRRGNDNITPKPHWRDCKELTTKFIEQSGNKGNSPNDTMVRMAEHLDGTTEFDSDITGWLFG